MVIFVISVTSPHFFNEFFMITQRIKIRNFFTSFFILFSTFRILHKNLTTPEVGSLHILNWEKTGNWDINEKFHTFADYNNSYSLENDQPCAVSYRSM